MDELKISIPAFAEGDWIPIEYTARGKDISPELYIKNICENAVSMAITLDDASHPLFPNYNHWVIWNLPIMDIVPTAIPKGENLEEFGGAVQGMAYGKHCYKGPKPPFKTIHTYTFTVYILDSKIGLIPKRNRKDFLETIDGHILQMTTYSGKFQSHRK
jgi:Raf kinase inhibitor-like YbhB/YbcL family protein